MFYEWGYTYGMRTWSGIKCPILVSGITPFKETVKENNLGYIFEYESIASLEQAIRDFLDRDLAQAAFGYDTYLSKLES